MTCLECGQEANYSGWLLLKNGTYELIWEHHPQGPAHVRMVNQPSDIPAGMIEVTVSACNCDLVLAELKEHRDAIRSKQA